MNKQIQEKIGEIFNRMREMVINLPTSNEIEKLVSEINEVIKELSKIALPSGYWVERKMVKNYPQKKVYYYYYLRYYGDDGRIHNQYLGKEIPEWVQRGLEARETIRKLEQVIDELRGIELFLLKAFSHFRTCREILEDVLGKEE